MNDDDQSIRCMHLSPPAAHTHSCREGVPGQRFLQDSNLFGLSTLLYALAVMDVKESRDLFSSALLEKTCLDLEQWLHAAIRPKKTVWNR